MSSQIITDPTVRLDLDTDQDQARTVSRPQSNQRMSEQNPVVPPDRQDSSEGTEEVDHKMRTSSDRQKPTPVQAPASVSHRINPDSRAFILAITIGVIIAGLVAFAISFVALMEVAAWLGLPWWMHWAVPTFIDLAILVYAGSVLIHRARGESIWKSWMMLAIFTCLSIVANVSHALSYPQDVQWQSIVGATIAGMVPFAVFAATEQLASVAVEDPNSRYRDMRRQQEMVLRREKLESEREEREHQQAMEQQERQMRREEHHAKLEVARVKHELTINAMREGLITDPAQLSQLTQPAPEPEPVQRQNPAPMDEVAEFISSRTKQGLDTTKHDIAHHFGCVEKTGYRRLVALRDQRPEIFLTQA
ncbi:DUF2637 domain-containing protein [Nesterenkonia rhizosphaerae]|uniref:DUF2637 domain-containing protein n=1 Tax=Nesterenkonia rhizosphaerae TaxID=1348272 RepID=A0ABP9G759_9MICC